MPSAEELQRYLDSKSINALFICMVEYVFIELPVSSPICCMMKYLFNNNLKELADLPDLEKMKKFTDERGYLSNYVLGICKELVDIFNGQVANSGTIDSLNPVDTIFSYLDGKRHVYLSWKPTDPEDCQNKHSSLSPFLSSLIEKLLSSRPDNAISFIMQVFYDSVKDEPLPHLLFTEETKSALMRKNFDIKCFDTLFEELLAKRPDDPVLYLAKFFEQFQEETNSNQQSINKSKEEPKPNEGDMMPEIAHHSSENKSKTKKTSPSKKSKSEERSTNLETNSSVLLNSVEEQSALKPPQSHTQLSSLTVEQVVALFESLKLPVTAAQVHASGVDGRVLMAIEGLSDLADLELVMPPIKARILLSNLEEYRRSDVPLTLIESKAPISPNPSLNETVKKESNDYSLKNITHFKDKAIPKVEPPKTHIFLTHDWGDDELGRSNHQRVSEINQMLQSRGIVTWFDEDRMSGAIVDAMTAGIDNSMCMAVFVTDRYMSKVNGSDGRDNCKIEYNYAFRILGPQKMIPIVMEPRTRSANSWKGAVGAGLGGLLYIDMANDDKSVLSGKVDDLVLRLLEIIGAA